MKKYQLGIGKAESAESRWKAWTIVQLPRNGNMKIWPITVVPFNITCHFEGTTKICTGPGCPYCIRNIPTRRVYYMQCLRVAEPTKVVLQVTEELVSQLSKGLDPGQLLTESALTLARSTGSRFSPTKLLGIEKSTLQAKTHSLDGSVESVLRLIGTPAEDIEDLAKELYELIKNGGDLVRSNAERRKQLDAQLIAPQPNGAGKDKPAKIIAGEEKK